MISMKRRVHIFNFVLSTDTEDLHY